ncbi:unnamed protein product [Thelazia callipaeda]|uniref:Pepsin-I3 domain-containing protein n=1 Tax=Thelazia callipaeda TaxID=103827 RepID=A0A0N5CY07_THECL|nr:unnamed protein product [Thelazia callipaeda]
MKLALIMDLNVSIVTLVFFVFVSIYLSNAQIAYQTGTGCVITGGKFYSHGRFIRNLTNAEISQVERYKKQMAEFQRKVLQTLNKGFGKSENDTLSLPQNTSFNSLDLSQRPVIPSFCYGKDAILYVFSGCSVQNYKLYVGQEFVRDVTSLERIELEKYAEEFINMSRMNQQDVNSIPDAKTPPTTIAPPTIPPSLDFCSEL